MGRQVNFYALEGDHTFLLQVAQDAGLLALPRVVPTEPYDLGIIEAAPLLNFQLPKGETYFYLIPNNLAVVEAFYQQMKNDPTKSWLKSWVSPVIEFTPSQCRADKVHHGRIYIDAPQNDPWSQKVYRAYKQLARRIRKWEKVSKSCYAGPETLQLARNGCVKIPRMRPKVRTLDHLPEQRTQPEMILQPV